MSLLRKSILYFSPPPVGVVCYRVYATSRISTISLPNIQLQMLSPLFFVNISDLDVLKNQSSYAACTTDKIFQSKNDVYDVYVDNQNIETKNLKQLYLLETTEGDKEKFEALSKLSGRKQSDEVFFKFFSDLNAKIFNSLYEVIEHYNGILLPEYLIKMGLDTSLDKLFLTDLIKQHGFDIKIVNNAVCCANF